MPFIGKKIRKGSAVFLLSSGFPFWLATEAITPQVVQAYTARVDLSIDRLAEENYETLLRRAEAAARSAAQRSFDQDILVTDVSIVVSVQNYGTVAPVLALDVSRPQWRTRPDPQRWATYFKTARSLLFFGQNFTTPSSGQPGITNTPPATPQPSAVDPSVRTEPINVPPQTAPAAPATQPTK
ncbi:hypothetical protein [Mastigocladopsis repens]|uniref:hypothetical protein n=1 Tax=Mastigocladopsis repens TaxID=221287 RepID=UPI0002E712E3|nr:hypothetical protein [Mastigocladopsis repens]